MMFQPQLWQGHLLVLFWLIQTFALTIDAIRVVMIFLTDRSNHDLIWYWSLIDMVTLKFEWQFYAQNRLQPLIYLCFELFRCIHATLLFIGNTRYAQYRSRILAEIVLVSGFWGAVVYAVYVLWAARRKQRVQNTDGSPSDIHYIGRVNTAARLTVDRPLLMDVINWLDTEPCLSNRVPEFLVPFCAWLVYAGKYVLSFFPVVVLMSLAAKLPGEPSKPQTPQDPLLLDNWKYHAPIVNESYSDSHRSLTAPQRTHNDLEAAAESLSLHPVTHYLQQAPRRDIIASDSAPMRLLRPQFLCFIADAGTTASSPRYVTRRVNHDERLAAGAEYVFISYTRRQFFTQIPNDPSLSEADRVRFQAATDRDKAILLEFAVAATQKAGAAAFWIDFECIRPDDQDQSGSDIQEVYRICDIVRASLSMAIVVGPGLDENMNHILDTPRSQWLLDWGKRLWTVPEALLCPSEHRISIYSAGEEAPEMVAKRNLPAHVWGDAGMLRQLIDHYEGSLQLTPIELVSTALECLQRRQTEKRNNGDVTYALMGLLRMRPHVNKADSDFEAFARLSLANDSNLLLERLLCIHSRASDAPWHDMSDRWQTKLWQFEPLFEIVGLGGSGTIVLSNTKGARIDWTSLSAVDYTTDGVMSGHRGLWVRRSCASITICVATLAGAFYLRTVIEQIMRVRYSDITNRSFAALLGYILLNCALALLVPWILSQHFRSELTSTQARLFGIEGRADLRRVERLIFGADCGRLQWDADVVDDHDEGESVDPHADAASPARTTYTLVDTLSCTATRFRAASPPQFLFAGATEHGRARAVLCAYDRNLRSFTRAAVVRLSPTMLPAMHTLAHFRLCMTPPPPAPEYADDIDDRIEIPDIPEFRVVGDDD